MEFINFRERAIHAENCLLFHGFFFREQKILVTRMSPNEKSIFVWKMKRPTPLPIVRPRIPSVLTRDESPGSLASESLIQCAKVTVLTRDLRETKPVRTHTHTYYAIHFPKQNQITLTKKQIDNGINTGMRLNTIHCIFCISSMLLHHFINKDCGFTSLW